MSCWRIVGKLLLHLWAELKPKPVRRAIRCGAQPACASRYLPSRLELITGSWLSSPLSSMDAFNGAGDVQAAVIFLPCKLFEKKPGSYWGRQLGHWHCVCVALQAAERTVGFHRATTSHTNSTIYHPCKYLMCSRPHPLNISEAPGCRTEVPSRCTFSRTLY